uniref:Uncharacterized protein n=1 Tax=Candidatus Methanophaga sp. ANME-1 ERB7 TaxID=2759913 RepID=A0A7G9Z7C4_9EURY|nr:hypothetical protein PNCMNLLH_00001 [Methanosarcinales archaeon ANME-1 ERB7]QNO56158.1 hypothetical protein LLPGBHFJ_00001 [Methanosarcinales archaeon ANME-1 ERB7]
MKKLPVVSSEKESLHKLLLFVTLGSLYRVPFHFSSMIFKCL